MSVENPKIFAMTSPKIDQGGFDIHPLCDSMQTGQTVQLFKQDALYRGDGSLAGDLFGWGVIRWILQTGHNAGIVHHPDDQIMKE